MCRTLQDIQDDLTLVKKQLKTAKVAYGKHSEEYRELRDELDALIDEKEFELLHH
jgi:hypothetical protein